MKNGLHNCLLIFPIDLEICSTEAGKQASKQDARTPHSVTINNFNYLPGAWIRDLSLEISAKCLVISVESTMLTEISLKFLKSSFEKFSRMFRLSLFRISSNIELTW